ncbi:MAG TPA: SDR family NAD(P)-dependent oxidoreductase [Acidimicrobiales bacterium]|nr:SDR family NAD(P)-dependent oxidoreductase [Acidimicrobiales bacterium]
MTFTIDLAGRRALVTGGGQGIGRATARALADAGGSVVVNDVVAERADAVAADIRGAGGEAGSAAFDVTDRHAVRAAIEALGGVDVLVNNAGNAGAEGFAPMVPFADTDPDTWDRYLRVNLYGVLNCTHAALPGMIARGEGRIVTVVSDAGRFGDAYLAPYAAAKAGAAGFCRSVAREVGRHGITVNCVSLGSVRTPATQPEELGSPGQPPQPAQPGQPQQPEETDEATRRLRRYIIRRYGEPADVAAMVTYLASPLASWITGQTYAVNGGYTLSL